MFRTLSASLLLVLAVGYCSAQTDRAQPRTVKVSASRNSGGQDWTYDADAERQLLDLANEARAEAGVSALQMDEGLTRAARLHAQLMASQQKLSHQFEGEFALVERIADTSTLHLDNAGENVAFGGNVQQAEAGLMHSPHHRENLLNAGYNVAGFGVVRSGYSLYVVQDFGHSLRNYSSPQSADVIATAVEQARRHAKLPTLERRAEGLAGNTACSMARADSLNVPVPSGEYILRYTSMQPETLPSAGIKAIDDKRIHGFSVGSCYARTSSYPNGAYWVALLLYY